LVAGSVDANQIDLHRSDGSSGGSTTRAFSAHTLSNTTAIPCPTPMHMVHSA